MAGISKNDKSFVNMYTIVVAAGAARSGGALTMYNQFINHLKNHAADKRYYIFVHQSMPKPEITGVEYIEIDVTSSLKRLKFDYYGCADYIKSKQIKADLVFSFENTGVRVKGIPQLILYQQGLPFYPKKWNPLKKSERSLFFYTYFYPFFVKLSLYKNSKVIVHTPYLKERFSNYYHFDKNRMYDMLPDVEKVDADSCEPYDFDKNEYHFLYPANNAKYKEHRTLVRALALMKKNNGSIVKNIKIHFSLKKEGNIELFNYIEKEGLIDNFVFDGFVSRDQLLSMYKGCTGLLFPSTIESVTLPLWEAVAFRKPIVCQNLDFARYQLEGYEGVTFVEVGNYESWCNAIIDTCNQKTEILPYTPVKGNSWEDLFNWINNECLEYRKNN